MRSLSFSLLVAGLLSTVCGLTQKQTKLLPVPQKVAVTDDRYPIDDSWVVTTGSGVGKQHPALLSLRTELKDRYGLRPAENPTGGAKQLQLLIKPGAISIGPTTDTNRTSLGQQAYRINLQAGKIVITANASAGLFYGVQTLVQLIEKTNDKPNFPGGEIVDWPDMDLRIIYWDNAHHLQRLDAMKRAIRQAGFYKINAFTVKLEGHFKFESAKPLVEPYAYSAADYAELSEYAKAHFVELVPWIDGPAHIAFILKHPEYKALRKFPNSNYELDVLNPKSDELLLGMFNELFRANKGGKYVLFSTDEAYYTGKSPEEKKRADKLGGNGRLLAEYISRIANKLHAQGRRVIIWAEFPLKEEDLNVLPSHIISGVYNKEWAATTKKHGMRQLIYTSTQGVEPHFPNYHKPAARKVVNNATVLNDDEAVQGEIAKGRVGEVLEGIRSTVEARDSDLMGVIVAAWGDAGLNPETFWLGYAAGAAPGWNHCDMTAPDLSQRFYQSFYGENVVNMDRMYELLSTQSDFWDKSWDWELSKWRTPIFGNSYQIFDTAKPAKDQTLPLMAVPSSSNLAVTGEWAKENAPRIEAARKALAENDELMDLLKKNMDKADFQQYNLQVLESVAMLCRQNLNMLLGLERINNLMQSAATLSATNPKEALTLIDAALDQTMDIRDQRNTMLQTTTTTWYQDWHPRVAEANGRRFLDLVDDVKDHQPGRTIDMSYLIFRQLKLPLGTWADTVLKARNEFAKSKSLPARTFSLNWEKY